MTEVRQHDIAGNVRAVTGSTCCEQVSATYTIATQYAYPASTTKGATGPTSPDRVTTTSGYDLNTGLPLRVANADGQVFRMYYSPETLRLDRIERWAPGSPTYSYMIAYKYYDAGLSVAQITTDAQNLVASQQLTRFNGLGLARRAETLGENGAWDIVETKYDMLGRLWKQSLPFRTGEGQSWTEIFYDSLGRVQRRTFPDGRSTLNYYNEKRRPEGASADPGETLRAADALGRERWTRLDAFGRLVEVLEPKGDGSGSVFSSGSLPTRYYYTALDQLEVVRHGSQMSYFVYDSLGRLTHQHLPEKDRTLNGAGKYMGYGMWSDVFTYDGRGNLQAHTDARGVRTIYDYGNDPLNRLKSINYDLAGFGDTANEVIATSNVTFAYMPTGDVTRLHRVVTRDITEEYGYNEKGLLDSQTLSWSDRPTTPQQFGYLYDNFDRLRHLVYPADFLAAEGPRKVMQVDYDVASRPKGLKVDDTDFASRISYNAASQVTSVITGSGQGRLTDINLFDPITGSLSRQKVIEQFDPVIGSTHRRPLQETGKTLLDVSYDYVQGSSEVRSVNNHTGQRSNRTYAYDALGRLSEVTLGVGVTLGTRPVPVSDWTQRYAYDAYGNRTLSKAFGPKEIVCTDPSDPFSRNCGVSRPELPSDRRDGLDGITYHPHTNRITTAGYGYDAEGNLVRAQRADGTWQRYKYDTAGRLADITDDIGKLQERYIYGEGRRRLGKEEKRDGFFQGRTYYAWSGDQVLGEYVELSVLHRPIGIIYSTSYVYLGERLLAKLPLVLNGNRDGINYHHPGRLGTRLTTDAKGDTLVNHEPYSFGTEDPSISTQGDTRRFTSYDRSTVTGLDYAVNRYYDPPQGRFTQPDPIGIGAGNLANPETLNMYAYVANDPINAMDPSGLMDDKDPQCGGVPDGTEIGPGQTCEDGYLIDSRYQTTVKEERPRSADSSVGQDVLFWPSNRGAGGGSGKQGDSEGGPVLAAHPWFQTNQAKVAKALMDLFKASIKPITKPVPENRPADVRPRTPVQGPPPPPVPPSLLRVWERWKLWKPSFTLPIFNPDLFRDPCDLRCREGTGEVVFQ